MTEPSTNPWQWRSLKLLWRAGWDRDEIGWLYERNCFDYETRRDIQRPPIWFRITARKPGGHYGSDTKFAWSMHKVKQRSRYCYIKLPDWSDAGLAVLREAVRFRMHSSNPVDDPAYLRYDGGHQHGEW